MGRLRSLAVFALCVYSVYSVHGIIVYGEDRDAGVGTGAGTRV